ncbi:MAG TPA: hypothetical protein VHL78_11740 [Actinomycetota bacterium]|nr:hypothetical protein [Actinomycetota bacterium]
MNETQIRDRLHAVAADAPAPTTVPRTVLRRARARVALTVGASLAIVVAVISGSAVGLRELAAPEPRPATPLPSPATPGALAYGVDGDMYVAESDGSNAIRIADGRAPSECGDHDEYHGEGMIWSPDGRYLAFRHRNCDAPEGFGSVIISDPEGNVVAEFPTGQGWDIGWSPDSTRVAVWASFMETIGVHGLDGERQMLLTVPPGMYRGGDHDPMWMPDGEALMFPWQDLVVPIDGSPPYRLELPHLPGDGYVTYSPDGSRVAYVANRSLVLAEADGSNPQVVFDDWVWEPVWSPTGDRIAFSSSGRGRLEQLRMLDVATGRVTLVTEVTRSETLDVIDFSPDGDRILFSREDDGSSSLWSINADGTDLRRLVAGTAWGDWLSVYAAPSSPPSPTPGTAPNPEASPIVGPFGQLGGWIAYNDGTGIWAINAQKAYPGVFSPSDYPDDAVRLAGPEAGDPIAWSVDGSRLLVRPGVPIGPPREALSVLDADGAETQVTDSANFGAASMSPDATQVVYAVADHPSRLELATVGDAPPEVLLSSDDGHLDAPAFSPDAGQIAFIDGGGDHSNALWVIDADGTNRRKLAGGDWSHVSHLVWSPDGERLAFSCGCPAGTGVYTIRADGAGLTLVSADGDLPMLQWSPDGSEIALVREDNDVYTVGQPIMGTLVVVGADGGEERQIARLQLSRIDDLGNISQVTIAWNHAG